MKKQATLLGALLLTGLVANAQVALTGANPTYTQDFNTLTTAGTTTAFSLTNWAIAETGTNANTDYRGGDGSSNTGDTYSFGTGTNTDRALGGVASGSLRTSFGVSFINNTGQNITSVNVAYVLEQWRRANATGGAKDTLYFSYSTDATSLTTGTWTSVASLHGTSINSTPAGTALVLDGNNASNRATISGTISGVTITPGSSLWVKWADPNIVGNDDGLGIDDAVFNFTTGGGGPIDTFARFLPTLATVAENSGSTSLSVNVSPTNANSSTFTANVVLKSGNAANIGNYTTQTVTFAPGVSTQTVPVTITDNGAVDGTKTFVFALRNPSAPLMLATDSLFTLTVTDDDAPVPTIPLYPIATVRGANGQGQPDSLNKIVRVAGTVYGVNLRSSGIQFFINDKTAGIGVFNPSETFGYSVQEGDSIVVTGTVSQFRGLAQMSFLDTIVNAGTSSVPAPTIVTGALGEATEGELIRINGVNLVNIGDWNTGGGASFNADVQNGNGTYQVRIELNTTAFSLAAPNVTFDVIGIGSQFATTTTPPFTNGYQIIPRKSGDIILSNSNEEEANKEALRVFPNPTTGNFNMLVYVQNAGEYTMNIVDMAGKTIRSKNVNLTAGNNMVAEDMSGVAAGVYHIRVSGANSAFTTPVVIK